MLAVRCSREYQRCPFGVCTEYSHKNKEKTLFSSDGEERVFQKLLDDYVKEYGLSGIRVFTDSQSFDLSAIIRIKPLGAVLDKKDYFVQFTVSRENLLPVILTK